jgi:catechol 2,3-dioxygenase-like lactoylglutathione lyase family enzyme
MSISKAFDVAYVRFRAPDLERMRDFLVDFGLVDAGESDDGSLFMRGYGSGPFLHATARGDAAFAGFGIQMRDIADLERLAAADGVAVEPHRAPGGGWIVRLTDPDGNNVEAVAGQRPVEPLPLPPCLPWNHGGDYRRQSAVRRVARGAAHVRRLGHVVLSVSDFRRSEAWYKERFGLITSDEIQPAPGVAIGAFMRADRGDEPSDHHTIFLLQTPAPPGFMHAAFEVVDIDDLMAGHAHLKASGREQFWGVGRHILGSQVFDYWKDPWGHEVEHWTDGDQFKASDGGGIADLGQLMGVQWGMTMPPLPPGVGL